ncbi:MAG: threonine aldolase family protein [Gemmatimonadota bacterium]
MIDLRSDTVTRPTAEMREAIAAAAVGDDVYGEDPTVNELEARVAGLLGKEAAVFVPTGTMSNQIALRVHTDHGDVAVMDANAHMILNEMGAAAALAGVTVRALHGRNGIFAPDDVERQFEAPHPFNPAHLQPRLRVVCVENTHNAGGGVIWPLGQLRAVAAVAHEHGLATHMDGARLWHASAASGVGLEDYADPFDTVSVCFSKGLGAPVGSALVGRRDLIDAARKFKQQYGGGFRQAGILAAAAIHALENHLEFLADDIEHARTFAHGLADMNGAEVNLDTVQSNIVRFRVTGMGSGEFVDHCHERGVHMLPHGAHGVRAVMHLDVSTADVNTALEVIRSVLHEGAAR